MGISPERVEGWLGRGAGLAFFGGAPNFSAKARSADVAAGETLFAVSEGIVALINWMAFAVAWLFCVVDVGGALEVCPSTLRVRHCCKDAAAALRTTSETSLGLPS